MTAAIDNAHLSLVKQHASTLELLNWKLGYDADGSVFAVWTGKTMTKDYIQLAAAYPDFDSFVRALAQYSVPSNP